MPRSGKPRKMTKRAESRLLRLVRKTVSYMYHYVILRTRGSTSSEFYIKIRVFDGNSDENGSEGVNRMNKRLSWCLARRWTVENDWKQVIFSDESQNVFRQNY